MLGEGIFDKDSRETSRDRRDQRGVVKYILIHQNGNEKGNHAGRERKSVAVSSGRYHVSHGASNAALSAKAYRGGLGSHEVLVAIGDHVVAKEAITLVRWPREARQHHGLHPLGVLNRFHRSE